MRLGRWIGLGLVVLALAGGLANASVPGERFLVVAWPIGTAQEQWLEVRDAAGRLLRLLTKNTAYRSVAVSPNGQLVTYTSVRGLMVSGLDGSNRRVLFRGVRPGGVAWSPDSSKVLVQVVHLRGGHYRTSLDVISVATGRRHRIVGPRYNTHYSVLAWSAAANQIAYISDHEYTPSVVIADPNGKSHQTICSNCGTPAEDPSVAWSPDGKRIAYIPGALDTLYVYDVTSKTTTHVNHAGYAPFWAPDSSRIAVWTLGRVKYYSTSGSVLGSEKAPGLHLLAWNANGLFFMWNGSDPEKLRRLYEIPTGQSHVQTVFTLPKSQSVLWAEPLG